MAPGGQPVAENVFQGLRLALHGLAGADDVDVVDLGQVDDLVAEAGDVLVRVAADVELVALDAEQVAQLA